MRLEMTQLAAVVRADGLQQVLLYRRDDGAFTFFLEELRIEPGPYSGAEESVYWLPIGGGGLYGSRSDAQKDAILMIGWLERF